MVVDRVDRHPRTARAAAALALRVRGARRPQAPQARLEAMVALQEQTERRRLLKQTLAVAVAVVVPALVVVLALAEHLFWAAAVEGVAALKTELRHILLARLAVSLALRF